MRTGDPMSPQIVFLTHLVLGYVAWLLCFGAYILPSVIGPNLPGGFSSFAAYGDLATGLLAILALLTVRIRPLFLLIVVIFNLAGAADILIGYYHGIQAGLPALSG